jgi:glycosyltransferase involved in cell wall biosynthesis
MNYIMITPVKNEQKFIREMIISVLDQKEKPKLWVIIDGGSIDDTREIVKEVTNSFYWIKQIHQRKFNSIGHRNVSLAVNEAYEYAVNYCKEHKIEYDYIWTIDADQTFDQSLCAGIITECEHDSRIGAASGQVYDNINGREVPDIYPEGELPNKRVYRREAIEEIGGFPVTNYSYDTVILAKLRIKGWKIIQFPEYIIRNLRADSGIERNAWKSSVKFGKARYYLGYSFLLMLLGCGYMAIHKNIGKSAGVFWGYLSSWMLGDEIINDKEVWNHFHYERIKEIFGGKQ